MTDAAALSTPARDRFIEARENLFPPVKNRAVAEAVDALQNNHLVLAESLLDRHLRKKPNDAEALNLMADIARRAKRSRRPNAYSRAASELLPERPGYRYNYSIILRLLHRENEALAELEKLLAADPENPLFRDQRATVLTALGRYADALVHRRKLVVDCPESADMWLRYAQALRDEGFQEKCVAAVHKALAIAPDFVGAWGTLADLKVYCFTPEEIGRMEALVRNSGISRDDRSPLHLALGKAYGDVKNYAKSFENYAKGNALRRLQIDFDAGRLKTQRLACERTYTASFFAERSGWGYNSRAPNSTSSECRVREPLCLNRY